MQCISTTARAPLTATATCLLVLSISISGCGDPDAVEPTATASPRTSSSTTAAPTTATSAPTTTPASADSASTTTTVAAPSSSTAPPVAVSALEVPQGSPPVVDGVLGADEWTDSVAETMSDGAAIHFMYRDETLYVGVAGDEVGAVNVLIVSEDAVWILHSSAALGSALYLRDEAGWALSHGFEWCCRSRFDDASRLALLDEEGWQANIGYTGDPGVVEYEIALPWAGAAVAVSSIRDDADRGFWPEQLSADAREQLLGVPPATRDFDLHEWPRLSPGE